jgi:predicted nucleic acid-binding protein
MTFVLSDTNILLRSSQPAHPMYQEAIDAVDELRRRGEQLCIMAQNLVEFRSVATRPPSVNGPGMSEADADTEIARLKHLFVVFADDSAILPEWERLVSAYGAAGKQNHDARLVAAMLAHGITTILTFNRDDFIRYTEITVLTPKDVLGIP